MFDAFKQAGAMAGIMKELPKLQARAKEITEMLEAARVVGEAGGGAVRARSDGRGRLVEVVVAPALASATEEIGQIRARRERMLFPGHHERLLSPKGQSLR